MVLPLQVTLFLFQPKPLQNQSPSCIENSHKLRTTSYTFGAQGTITESVQVKSALTPRLTLGRKQMTNAQSREGQRVQGRSLGG